MLVRNYLVKAFILKLVVMSVISCNAFANIQNVPRRASDFLDMSVITVENIRVTTARVVMANYDLIARDFPSMRSSEGESIQKWHNRIDEWLLKETAFIHPNQIHQQDVNTAIEISSETKPAYRPRGYNRAHVIAVGEGFMDAKGVGTFNPQQRHHRNGLATLGEVVREYLFEKMVSQILRHSEVNANTVGNYAVIDYGFDVVHEDNNRDRAGYILRQAHRRSRGTNSLISNEDASKVEEALRRFGVTASGETYGFRSAARIDVHFDFDYLNLQGTSNSRMIEIIDFGAFLAVPRFEYELRDTIATNVVMDVTDPNFTQPKPEFRVPLEQWGNFGYADPKRDRPWVWSHELAKAWAEGRAHRVHFEQHERNMMDPFLHILKGKPLDCKKVYVD